MFGTTLSFERPNASAQAEKNKWCFIRFETFEVCVLVSVVWLCGGLVGERVVFRSDLLPEVPFHSGLLTSLPSGLWPS